MATPPGDGSSTTAVGARGIVLLAAALILGVILLNEFDTGPVPFSERVEVDDGPSTTSGLPTVTVVPTTTARAARAPADIRVLAANGTSTAGLGGRTTELLRNSEYNALAPIDSSRTVDATIVAYRADFDVEARALAQLLQLPLSAVRPLDETTPIPEDRDADIVVVVGPDLDLP